MKNIFINPYTDFGFKRIFGTEANKNLLIDFLNQLLPTKHKIVNLSFGNSEQIPKTYETRKAIFDIFCTNENGEHFTVEMQKAKMRYFKDRSLFYLTFPIQSQAEKGENWDFKLNPIYLVAILDFEYTANQELIYTNNDLIKINEQQVSNNIENNILNYEQINNKLDEEIKLLKKLNKKLRAEDKKNRDITKYITNVQLKDQDNIPFYDKLNLQFVQMPLFTKKEHELTTQLDKWLYFLKHLPSFNEIPRILNEPIFRQAFKTAKISNFSEKEHLKYRESFFGYCEMLNLKKEKESYKESAELKDKMIAIGVNKLKKSDAEKNEALLKIKNSIIVMFKKNYSDKLINEILNIPIEEIKIIRQKIN